MCYRRDRSQKSGVNFTNVLRAAFRLEDPKSTKKTVKLSSFFALLGSSCVKAARKHIGEIDCRREGRIRRQVKKTSSVQNKMVRESGPTGIKQEFK